MRQTETTRSTLVREKTVKIGHLILSTAFTAATLSSAEAVPIVSADPGSTVTQFAGPYLKSTVPVVVENGVIVTSTFGNSDINDHGTYNLVGNGSWSNGGPNGIGYVAVNDAIQVVRFTLPSLVSQVGAFLNYVPGFGPFTIRVLDDSNQVIESLQISGNSTYDILTPGAINAGAFRGFDVGSAIIRSFELEGGFGAATDLSFSALATDAPELDARQAWLPLLSVLMLVALRRKESAAR
ncbi:MAG: hypothetical protein J0I12_18315 [Candidatus Eremiobacteraeota bacterium]|nr:hypothetical protein [Candidatus Eremiobacteraeota bacterium]